MKRIYLAALMVASAPGIALLVLASNANQSTRAQRGAPTSAPPPTAGPPPTPLQPVWPVLDKPLTQEQAVIRALEIDEHFAIWQEPWSQETFQNQPDRITIEWHSDRSHIGNEYGPEAQMGPVWVISIKGPVKLIGERLEESYHDGLAYTIAQNSWSLLRWSAGPYVK
jgi:hypothetical protein